MTATLLPYLGKTPETETWTSTQLITFASVSYAMVALYAALIILAASNFKQFFISNAEQMKGSPLLVFYLLAVFCLVSDIVYSIFIVEIEVNDMPIVFFLPPTLKVSLGFEQLWMMIELSMRVNQVIRAFSAGRHNSTEEERTD